MCRPALQVADVIAQRAAEGRNYGVAGLSVLSEMRRF